MYQLYIANKNYSSWSLRPWVLMSELNIPFEETLVPFKGTTNFEEFKKFSPSATVPCLYDDPLVVWDSLAICEYLAENHTGVWPSERAARAWARCATAEMHSGFASLRTNCGMNIGVRVKLFDMPTSLMRDIRRVDEIWREGLTKFGGPYLTGQNFTAVDAFYAPVVFRMQTFDLPITDQARAYCELLLSLNSMQQWQTDALQESWRDASHESEMLEYGQVIQDNRKT